MIISNRRLGAVVFLLIAALAGLVTVQAVLLRQAWQREAQTFQRNVLSAMALTVQQLDALEIAGDATYIIRGTLDDSLLTTVDSIRSVADIDTMIAIGSFPDSMMAAFLQRKPDGSVRQVDLETRSLTVTVEHDRRRFIQHVVRGIVDTERPPITARLDAVPLDSILIVQLGEAGIDARPEVGVIGTIDDVPVRLPAGADTTAFVASPLRTRVFDLDLKPPFHDLVLVFPGERSWVLRRMAPLLGLSLVFVIVVIAALVQTVRTLLEQRRFAGQVVDFVNNMTHEFKTPLSTLTLAADAIAREAGPDDASLRRHARMIREETVRMGLQAERILQVARLEQGELDFAPALLDGNLLVRCAAESFALRVQQRDGELATRTEAELSGLRGDEMHLTGVLDNLLDNALKYSPAKPDITMATFNRDGSFIVTVADRGQGVPQADRERVFDPYFRCATGDRHNVKGYGLGLSFVRLVVRAHGGNVVLEPNPGGGSCVRVTLPLIFLTARSLVDDRVEGLRLGADDYVTKPFSLEELVLRIDAVLRRCGQGLETGETATAIQVGTFIFDPVQQTLVRNAAETRLTARESELLHLLAASVNRTVARTTILRRIWGDDGYHAGRSMDVFVSRLRKHLAPDPSVEIRTIHGKGLKLIGGR